jgi:cyclase
MLKPRIIPVLLVSNGGLVKTVRFSDPKYVGDPVNAVKIFNEKNVDELVLIDIEATSKKLEPNYALIERVAIESRMPLCYGGGIKTLDQAKRIISLGVEKISISSEAISNPNLISDIASFLGSQSVAVVLDVRQIDSQSYIFTNNGTKNTNINTLTMAAIVGNIGAGELIINSIDRDGTMMGYDLDLITKIYSMIQIPMTAIGGAGNLKHMDLLFNRCGIMGAGAGSLFVFKGPYKAVLINYPTRAEKDILFNSSQVNILRH